MISPDYMLSVYGGRLSAEDISTASMSSLSFHVAHLETLKSIGVYLSTLIRCGARSCSTQGELGLENFQNIPLPAPFPCVVFPNRLGGAFLLGCDRAINVGAPVYIWVPQCHKLVRPADALPAAEPDQAAVDPEEIVLQDDLIPAETVVDSAFNEASREIAGIREVLRTDLLQRGVADELHQDRLIDQALISVGVEDYYDAHGLADIRVYTDFVHMLLAAQSYEGVLFRRCLDLTRLGAESASDEKFESYIRAQDETAHKLFVFIPDYARDAGLEQLNDLVHLGDKPVTFLSKLDSL